MGKLRTINTKEDIPNEFYIFLNFRDNILDQMNKNNYINTKKLKSTGFNNVFIDEKREAFFNGDMNYLPLFSKKLSTEFLSPFILNLDTKSLQYNVEYNLELTREKFYKQYPSRFSGILAFGDQETCANVALAHNWDLNTVRKFKLINMRELNKYVKVGKFNMGIVSLLNSPNISPYKQDELYYEYWNCSKSVNLDIYNSVGDKIKCNDEVFVYDAIQNITINRTVPVYEYLIEGILEEIPL